MLFTKIVKSVCLSLCIIQLVKIQQISIILQMESDKESDSGDSEVEESLPICVQGNLSRLRKERLELRNIMKTLKKQLQKSQAWAGELEKEVKHLKDRMEELEADAKDCKRCKNIDKDDCMSNIKSTQTSSCDLKYAEYIWDSRGKQFQESSSTWEVCNYCI